MGASMVPGLAVFLACVALFLGAALLMAAVDLWRDWRHAVAARRHRARLRGPRSLRRGL